VAGTQRSYSDCLEYGASLYRGRLGDVDMGKVGRQYIDLILAFVRYGGKYLEFNTNLLLFYRK
jgi:hypothetical protein